MVTRIHQWSGRKRTLYLREWRKDRHLSQLKVANRLDTTVATISRYETSNRTPSTGYLDALADALNCEPPDFYRHPDSPTADALLRDAEPDQQKQILKVIAALLKTG